MKFTNATNLPQPIVDAVLADNYSRGESNRSVTQLIGSPRQRILHDIHDDEIVIDCSERAWVALGKAVHHLFESHTDPTLYEAEERLFMDVLGWTISGAMDLQHSPENPLEVVIWDYKVTSVWAVLMDKPEWEQQLNFYAHLVENNKTWEGQPVKVVGLKIAAIVRDHKLRDQLIKKDYPAPITILEFPVWTAENRKRYVEQRVRMHQEAEFTHLTGGTLPLCTDEERWRKPTKYAVKKPKNKTAKRVLDTLPDAEQYIRDNELEGFIIEERPAEATRCAMGWCKAAPFCDQWQNELEQEKCPT